jgi:uncharacterized protein (TIGR00730 family)
MVYNVQRRGQLMPKSKKPDPTSLDIAIDELLLAGGMAQADTRTQRLTRSLVETALALGSDGVAVPDLKLVDAALAEIRNALGRFHDYKSVRKVTVFGSARTDPESTEYDLAREFSRRIADREFMVITGAGPGIMQAGNEGAGRDRSFGVNIRLPFEQSANPIIAGDPKLADFKYFFTRKLFFLKESSAVALFPGGFGTHDEAFETLTLVQTGKSQLVPIVFLDVPKGTYWKTWHQYVQEHLLRKELIGADDLALYKVTDDIDEALDEITGFYRVYHSLRTIRGRLVMRTNHEIDATVLTTLSDEFSDILADTAIVARGPYDEESDEPELADLPRLVLKFDQRHQGRLRMLINRLNELG